MILFEGSVEVDLRRRQRRSLRYNVASARSNIKSLLKLTKISAGFSYVDRSGSLRGEEDHRFGTIRPLYPYVPRRWHAISVREPLRKVW